MKKFISALMIVVLAFVLVSCGGGAKVDGKWVSAYIESSEGKMKMEGMITLDFKDGGKGTISAMGFEEEFTYKLDGSKVTLTLQSEGDVTGSVDGEILTIDDGSGEKTVFCRDLEKFDMPKDAKSMFDM